MIPTLNAQSYLPACFNALIPAVVEGLVREVIIVDGGSSDLTAQIADEAGARFLTSSAGRGTQMAEGARHAKSDWLLFLHADTVLDVGWERDVSKFMRQIEEGAAPPGAAAFRFALDDHGARPRILEALVALRSSVLRLPYGDQAVLIPKRLYEDIGGFRDVPLMEDVDLICRLRRDQLTILRTRAITSAVRFRRDGYVKRSARNLFCLLLYYLNVPSKTIARFYD